MTDNANAQESADSAETQKISVPQDSAPVRDAQALPDDSQSIHENAPRPGSIPASADSVPLHGQQGQTVRDASAPGDSAQKQPGTVTTPLHEKSSKPRTSTIIWGLILIAFGAVLLALTLGYRIDLQLFAIAGLGIAGVVLLVSALIGAKKNN